MTMRMRTGLQALQRCYLLGLLVSPTSTSAKTWNVSPGQPAIQSIQAAIDSSESGDIIVVQPGTYDESIDFKGKSVRIYSTGGPEVTVLDGGGRPTPVVTFSSGEPREAQLEGFTIQHGNGFQVSGFPARGGGGIFIYDAEPTIRNNIVQSNNTPLGAGGGIYCSGSPGISPRTWKPEISSNVIQLNEAVYQGGGIYVVNAVAPLISGNVIQGNSVEGDGGGISLRVIVPGARVLGNRIVGNSAGDHAGGITAVTATNPPPVDIEISWNLISDNIALHESGTEECGAGIWLGYMNAWVHHNTIVLNECQDSEGGGGISVISYGLPLIERNIIALTKSGGPLFCGLGGQADVRDNIFWANPVVEETTCGDLHAANLFEDPMFCDPGTMNFQVSVGSVALNHPLAPIGAFDEQGCQEVPVRAVTWGRVKHLFWPRPEGER
jgi:parallel beta helix pectate lyase-like protein